MFCVCRFLVTGTDVLVTFPSAHPLLAAAPLLDVRGLVHNSETALTKKWEAPIIETEKEKGCLQ